MLGWSHLQLPVVRPRKRLVARRPAVPLRVFARGDARDEGGISPGKMRCGALFAGFAGADRAALGMIAFVRVQGGEGTAGSAAGAVRAPRFRGTASRCASVSLTR